MHLWLAEMTMKWQAFQDPVSQEISNRFKGLVPESAADLALPQHHKHRLPMAGLQLLSITVKIEIHLLNKDRIQEELPLDRSKAREFELEETETKDVIEIPAQENLPQAVALKKAESEPTNSSERRSESGHSWVKKELLSDSNSLKRAFVLKEILDKPKSLKSLSS